MGKTRRPPAERFEVRFCPSDKSENHIISWHRSKQRAVEVAQKRGQGYYVVWTHPDDGYLEKFIDDAMIVWP